MGGGYPPFNYIQQGITQIFVPSTKYYWQPGASYNLGQSFQVSKQ
jgi:hypothetical protein